MQPIKYTTNRYIFLRHGMTSANAQKIYMGRLDVPLNQTGVGQAENVSIPYSIDIILHSPLVRTSQTAAIVNKKIKAPSIKEDARLIEKSGGDIEGMTYSNIETKYPDSWGLWHTSDLHTVVSTRFPNGESDLDVAIRLKLVIDEMEKSHINKTILFVTHSGVIWAARYLFGKSMEEIYSKSIPNCHFELYPQEIPPR